MRAVDVELLLYFLNSSKVYGHTYLFSISFTNGNSFHKFKSFASLESIALPNNIYSLRNAFAPRKFFPLRADPY